MANGKSTQYKPKAERAFEEKSQRAMDLQSAPLMREVGEQYDAYLKLIEPWTDEYVESMTAQPVTASGG